ncbi:TIGR02206 family membrane protein [Halobacillus litoralis]|uniref:YwaF family protein n=1 Tax=Halobacillus litoralis TaxID=45668 RepID=UPI001CD2DDDA|nr:TIGR02206 family membrane protein [Halobacillus litoralis]MCA0971087.1 TIGR02206 family membrane protein [Halobacillus litoralis]
MDNWFQAYSSHPFVPFTLSHWIALIVFAAGLSFILLFAEKISRHPGSMKFIRLSLLILLFISEVSYQYWAVTNGVWSTTYYIPLHLCGIASIVGIAALVTYHPKLIKLNYFIGIIPALIALITPDLLYDYQHFRFWKFFIHHMAIIWTSVFLVVTASVNVSWGTMFKAYFWLVIYGVVVGFINTILGANYMFLNGPPEAATPLDYMGDGLWYYLNLGIVALVVFALMKLLHGALIKNK